MHRWLRAEIEEEGVDSRRLIVGGFSQGGLLALMAGLSFDQPIGGIVLVSSRLQMPDFLKKVLYVFYLTISL